MLKKLKKNKKGFTLAELLIVVAIIGVLVAVSIPIFTSQLEKAREATDLANMRAAKAALVTEVLDESYTDGTIYVYDAANGQLADTAPTAGYGKGTASGDYTTDAATAKYFWVTYDKASDQARGTWAASKPITISTTIEAAYTPKTN